MKFEHDTEKPCGNMFLTAPETAKLLNTSTSHAYKVIHRLNQELKTQGFITIAGRISREYLLERTAGRKRGKEALENGSL